MHYIYREPLPAPLSISFGNLYQLIAAEALYQGVAAQFLTRRIMLSRQEFVSRPYLVAVDVDGMLELAKSGKPVNIVQIDVAPANGRGGRT